MADNGVGAETAAGVPGQKIGPIFSNGFQVFNQALMQIALLESVIKLDNILDKTIDFIV